MIANIGANTFFVFMAFDIAATIFSYIFVTETRGKILEVAAGTEWQVQEKSDAEQQGRERDRKASKVTSGAVPVAVENDSKALNVVHARDAFTTNFKHRSKA